MSSFYENLEAWIDRQKKIKEMFMKAEQNYNEADRLTLIMLSRQAFHHIERTIEAFDNWLKDPLIQAHMPREMLIELWSKLREILYMLIDLDIDHTRRFAEYLKKLEEANEINPLFTLRLSTEEGRERRRGGVTPVI